MGDKQKNAVHIWLARCPNCRGSNLNHYGTRKNARGETVRYYQCRNLECKTKFPGIVMNADDDDQFDEISEGIIPPRSN